MVVVGLYQLFALNRQFKSDALFRLHEQLLSSNVQESLRIIYASTAKELMEKQNGRLREATERVLNLYDLIGYRVKSGTLPKADLIRTERYIILRVAQKLKGFIESERNLRRDPSYKAGFTYLLEQIGRDNTVRGADKIAPAGDPDINDPWSRVPKVKVYSLPEYRNSRPCVAVFIIWQQKLLLLRPTLRLEWDLPGGFLDEGEEPLDGAKREVLEETQLNIGQFSFIGAHIGDYGIEISNGERINAKTLNMCYCTKIDTVGWPLVVIQQAEISGYTWVEFKDEPEANLAFPWMEKAWKQACEWARTA